MAIPRVVRDIVHNAKHCTPPDGQIYTTGIYAIRHMPATPMHVEQIRCDGPAPAGVTAKGYYRSIRSAQYASGWSPIDYVCGNIAE